MTNNFKGLLGRICIKDGKIVFLRRYEGEISFLKRFSKDILIPTIKEYILAKVKSYSLFSENRPIDMIVEEIKRKKEYPIDIINYVFRLIKEGKI